MEPDGASVDLVSGVRRHRRSSPLAASHRAISPSGPCSYTITLLRDEDARARRCRRPSRRAASGDPDAPRTSTWPAFTAANDACLDFGDAIRTATGLNRERCDAREAWIDPP